MEALLPPSRPPSQSLKYKRKVSRLLLSKADTTIQ